MADVAKTLSRNEALQPGYWISDNTMRIYVERRKTEMQAAQAPGAARFPILASIILNQWFELAISILVLANCITMGIEAQMQVGNLMEWGDVVDQSEHVFTAIFLIELVARTVVFGWKTYMPFGIHGSLFNFFDAFLVLVTGVCATWMLPLVGAQNSDDWRILTMLRACRLMRLVRVVRKVQAFHEVWLLLRGLSESMWTLFWTLVVIFFLTYTFSVFGVVSISVNLMEQIQSTNNPSERAAMEELYVMINSVPNMMYTLIQFLTLDSWNAIARPLQGYITWSWIFFYSYISVAVIVLMNLVTAIIVENALKNSAKDEEQVLAAKEKAKRDELANVKTLFGLIDLDSDGVITYQEFEAAFQDPELSMKLKLLDIDLEELHDIFRLLDTGDGSLDLEEFFEGLTKMDGLARSKDLFKVAKNVETILRLLAQFIKENQEDTQLLLNRVIGSCPERGGSLKSRAATANSLNNIKPGESVSLNEMKPTPTGTPNGTQANTRNANGDLLATPLHSLEPNTLNDLLARLETAVLGIEQCRQDVRNCEETIKNFAFFGEAFCEKVEILSKEVFELKTELASQRLQIPSKPSPLTGSGGSLQCCQISSHRLKT